MSEDFKTYDIKLSSRISARSSIGMLIMQPIVHNRLSFNDGYRWQESFIEGQLGSINQLMDLAENNIAAGHNTDTDLVIIPEYGIPGTRGVDLILERLRTSDVERQIVIGGIDGLNKREFLNLLEGSEKPLDSQEWITSTVTIADWVNSAIIIEKSPVGIKYYLQPKLLPAALEDNTGMCYGNTLLVFRTSPLPGAGPNVHFFVPICFDWIGRRGCTCKIDGVTESLLRTPELNNALWLIFGIQHNPKPDHIDFLSGARSRLLEASWLDIFDTRACIIMANTASELKSRWFGQSSFIFSSGRYTSYNEEPLPVIISKTREILKAGCEERRFRENGPVIHACYFNPPTSVVGHPGDARSPFSQVKLTSLSSEYTFRCQKRWPCTCSSVSAYVKVIGDLLDIVQEQLKNYPTEFPLFKELLFQGIEEAINQSRQFDEQNIKKTMKLLCKWSEYNCNCDLWIYEKEGIALENLTKAIASFSVIFGNLQLSENYHSIFCAAGINGLIIMNGKYHSKMASKLNEDIAVGEIASGTVDRIVGIGFTETVQGYVGGSLLELGESGSFIDPPRIIYIPSHHLICDMENAQSLEDVKQSFLKRLEVSQ